MLNNRFKVVAVVLWFAKVEIPYDCVHIFYDCAHILMIVCTSSLGAPPLHHCHRLLPHSPHHCQPAIIEDGLSSSSSL